VSEYSALMAGMEFEFHGEKMSRAELMGYSEDDDRETRKECYEALGNTLMAHSEKLDRIFDDLVHVRDRMAKKMGYENFIELGYYRMNRISYNSELVAAFRENVKNNLVPVVAKLRNRVADDLGLDRVMLYDLGVIVPGGDPKPGDKESIFAAAKEMYHDMSPITSAFIDMMMDNEAFDVEGRKNKWGGGYCTVFSKYRQPFILANFNGSNDDVDTMTHEVGHALNDYLTLDNEYIVELGCGGMETAETHSMGMEFFCWPYMEKFYGEKAPAYRYRHAVDSMSFIPYGTMVDAFQHIVYANPDLTPAQRNEAWLQLEKDYRPFLSMEGMPYLEKGTRWQYQMHIYETPFYYIDYCLAQTAAFQFLLASQENYDDAFAKYMKLSKQGGEKEWPELLKEAGFRSPFEEGALAEIAEKMEQLVMKIKV
ncbi:MAG: M3 family oligoendopeptidase, partial [Oscillospiraceae bacterium]|nr:M3 family oligoendopeptidase [Oscillospiraceae bacterium]